MVLSVPALPDRASGLRLTATIFKSDVTDAVNFLANPPVFLGYQSAVQSIPASTATAIGMNTSTVDSYSGHSNVTNNSRYTATAAGWYVLLGSVSFAANATGNRLCEFRVNGGATSSLGQGAHPTTDVANNPTPNASTMVFLNGISDYVELFAYQTSGGALNTVASQSGFAAFWMHS